MLGPYLFDILFTFFIFPPLPQLLFASQIYPGMEKKLKLFLTILISQVRKFLLQNKTF